MKNEPFPVRIESEFMRDECDVYVTNCRVRSLQRSLFLPMDLANVTETGQAHVSRLALSNLRQNV